MTGPYWKPTCPYMAPEPVRGTRNDSRNIVHVAAYIGTLWDMDAQAVLDRTAANARACFGVYLLVYSVWQNLWG